MHAKDILNKEHIVTELWRLPATELAHVIRMRKVSAREAALERLTAANPGIDAIVAHRPELVLEQADRLDRTVARGEDPGPMAGVSVNSSLRKKEDSGPMASEPRAFFGTSRKLWNPVVRAGSSATASVVRGSFGNRELPGEARNARLVTGSGMVGSPTLPADRN
jgi:hypothetical protein